jgi:hypothetical protein
MITRVHTAIEVRGLAKRFGDVIAVAGIEATAMKQENARMGGGT